MTWGTLQLQSGCVRSSVCACASKAPLRSRPDHHRSTRPFFAVSTGGWPRRFDNATAQRDFVSIEPGPYARGFPPPPGTRRAYDFRTGGLPTPRGALGGPRGPPREPPGPPRAPAPRAPLLGPRPPKGPRGHGFAFACLLAFGGGEEGLTKQIYKTENCPTARTWSEKRRPPPASAWRA